MELNVERVQQVPTALGLQAWSYSAADGVLRSRSQQSMPHNMSDRYWLASQ